MTYLQLVQALHREAGLAGSAPASVSGQAGMAAKLVGWIAEAWTFIQTERKWSFLLTEADVTLTVSQRDYTLAALGLTNVREFDPLWAGTLLADGSDIWRLYWLPYAAFRERYGLLPSVAGRPTRVTLIGNTTLRFDVVPDAIYKARLAYWQTAATLTANADVPAINEEEQWVIVWQALMLYAAHEGAADVYADAQAKYKKAFNLLCQRYLPDISFGAPLV